MEKKKMLILYFVISLFFLVITYWFLLPGRCRKPFLLVLSLLFIGLFNIVFSVYYLLLLLIVYLLAILGKENPKKKKGLLYFSLILLIGNLCFYKYTEALIISVNFVITKFFSFSVLEIPDIFFPVGLSYITFRLVHYVIEVYKGKINPDSFLDFSLYVLFFPTFLAGPVDRFSRFKDQADKIEDTKIKFPQINYGLFRILLGLAKKFFIADSLYMSIFPVIQHPQDFTRAALIFSIYLSAIWLYMELSGYTDMAIGIARLFGYNIVENFNWPYLQKNIALFWRNWHISVYSWIRDYFYLPFFVYKGSKIKLYLGTFCTIMIFMLWHKASWGFLFAGIYHGTGLVLWNLFQELKKKYLFLRKIFNHSWIDPLSIAFTFSFVAFGVSIPFFARDFNHIKIVILKLAGG